MGTRQFITATAAILGIYCLIGIKPAAALTCPAYPNTFSNGTTADAGQVNANFSSILTCANTSLAPLNAPAFTGSLGVSGTITDATAGDTVILATFQPTMSPTAASGVNSVAFAAIPTYDTTFDFTGTGPGAPTGGLFQNLIINTGAIADISGANIYGLWLGGDAASMGTVASVKAAELSPVVSFSNSLTSTVTKAIGLHISDSQKNTLHVTGQAGVAIDALAAATNNTALLIGQAAVPTGAFGIYNASANNNYLNGSVGIGTSAPAQKLEVNGKIKIDSFGSATASTVCQLSGVLSSCSSSRRYKENIANAEFGLEEVEKLRPVTFKWKGRDERDFGFVAEEVEKINPLFVSYKDGRVEGVKYQQLTALLARAVQDQQAVIQRLKEVSAQQASDIQRLVGQVVELRRRTGIQTAQR